MDKFIKYRDKILNHQSDQELNTDKLKEVLKE